jgi:hypothetical protein
VTPAEMDQLERAQRMKWAAPDPSTAIVSSDYWCDDRPPHVTVTVHDNPRDPTHWTRWLLDEDGFLAAMHELAVEELRRRETA